MREGGGGGGGGIVFVLLSSSVIRNSVTPSSMYSRLAISKGLLRASLALRTSSNPSFASLILSSMIEIITV